MKAELLKLWNIVLMSWANQAQASSGHTGQTHGVWIRSK